MNRTEAGELLLELDEVAGGGGHGGGCRAQERPPSMRETVCNSCVIVHGCFGNVRDTRRGENLAQQFDLA